MTTYVDETSSQGVQMINTSTNVKDLVSSRKEKAQLAD